MTEENTGADVVIAKSATGFPSFLRSVSRLCGAESEEAGPIAPSAGPEGEGSGSALSQMAY